MYLLKARSRTDAKYHARCNPQLHSSQPPSQHQLFPPHTFSTLHIRSITRPFGFPRTTSTRKAITVCTMVTATETPGAPVAVANGVAKPKQKLSKNQLRRAKKKQQKAGGSSRESSVVSASESESESVSLFPMACACVQLPSFSCLVCGTRLTLYAYACFYSLGTRKATVKTTSHHAR